jgi:type VII secretion integral membrane protein EccD
MTSVIAPVGAAAPAARNGAAAPGRPPTTRVTVLTGRRMTDLVLPASAPMDSYLDDTVAALAELSDDAPADVLAGFDFAAQGVWAFTRPGGPPLRGDQSLDDAGVVDGTLLTLATVSHTERYRPLVEDVIDAIAVLDESPQFDRSALNRAVAVGIPIILVALSAVAVQAWWTTGRNPLWPAALGILGVLLLAGSLAAMRIYKNAGLSESLLVAAFPATAVAAALAVPLPAGSDGLGAPQLAGGAAAVMFLALITRGGPQRRAQVASFVVVLGVAVIAAAIAFGYGLGQWVASGAILFGLFTITNAAKLTVAIARIALPPIPAPGENVEVDELLDPVTAGGDTAGTTRTWKAIIASVPQSAVRLTERSELAKQLLIGIVVAGTVVMAAGAIAVVVPGHFLVHSTVVAGLVSVACGFRARLYAERWCAWALLAAAVVIPLGVVVRLSQWFPSSAWWMLSAYLGTAAVALAVIAATAGMGRISPVSKRILEIIDGVVVAAIIPMLLWIAGVYDMFRNLRF